jgi:hypothetical protein
MSETQFTSGAPSPFGPGLSQRLMGLFSRSQAMGLLSVTAAKSEPLTTGVDLGGAAVRGLVADLQRHGIGIGAKVSLAPLMQDKPTRWDAADARALETKLDQLTQALEDSPAPVTEWPALREVLGDELLGDLLEVSPSSLRRYAGGERETPEAIVMRLHWLAMVTSDLAGGYNHLGMRRWFQRPRAQLKGQSPRQALGTSWHPDDAAATQVRALASALNGAQTLAV